jgi:hypothetical protein
MDRSISLLFCFLIAACRIERTTGQCSICGEGKVVSQPNAIFTFPKQPAYACGVLETAGKNGQIPLNQCLVLPSIVDVCQCIPADSSSTIPTSSPMTQPTLLPVTNVTCSVCGEGKQVGRPEQILQFPNYPNITCAEFQNFGQIGIVPLDQCQTIFLQLETCACEPIPQPTQAPILTAPPTATVAPITAPPVTQAPITPLPTSQPSPQPTFDPTLQPTPLTTLPPTPQPTRPPTRKLTKSPTKLPTRKPTKVPTKPPTRKLTKVPSKKPTRTPTRKVPIQMVPTKRLVPTRRPLL